MQGLHATQGLRRAAQLAPEKIGLTCGEHSLTWASLEHRVSRLAGVLQEQGLAPGDRVALLALSGLHTFEYFYAVPWAGGVVVPVNYRLALPELSHILRDSGAKILILDQAHSHLLPALQAAVPELQTLLVIDPPSGGLRGAIDYQAAIEQATPIPDQLRGNDELWALIYTGGTTGLPKGVMLSHGNLVVNTLVAINILGFTERSAYLHAAPLFHCAGAARIYSTVMARCHSVVLPKFEVETLLAAIESHGINKMLMIPTMLNRLLNHPNFEAYDLSSLKDIAYGAAVMPRAVLERAFEKLPGVRFSQSYGMTELSPTATVLSARYHTLEGPDSGRLDSCGQAVFNADLRIVDDDDRECPPGEVGEITVRGPMVMQGYWNLPEQTAETLRGGWMHTGDAGYMDDEGFVYLVDRIKDMIISGGENIYSKEVEDAIYHHPAVLECAVIGVPHPEWGEAVHAVVVPRENQSLTEAELIEYCRGQIAGYKCPRSVEIRQQPLPLSGAAKVLKTALRDAWQKKSEDATRQPS
ncbi:MAG: long-chain fatty acid--CoA ligase [Gammaproteobacteria bacterium]|nr:long-chain fatty acid--CoA ligase [Gammaproteobacteria bacterium]